MSRKSNEKISLIDLSSRNDGAIEDGVVDLSWKDVLELLSRHHQREKKDGPCFIPVRLKPREDWVLSKPRKDVVPTYRNDENVESITMAVLDLDKEGALEKAEAMFKENEYIIYSTHSYRKDAPHKFRMVIRLDNPIPAENWPGAFKRLVSKIDADRSCGNYSRLFYYPSTTPDADMPPIFRHHNGEALSLAKIMEIPLSEEQQKKESRQYKNNDFFVQERKHFTGKSVENSPIDRHIDYSYEGICKRHQSGISELVSSDSRHNFALSVSAREVGMLGGRANIHAMVQFMYRAAEQYSSKPLSAGDTPQELPEIIESAFIKYAPDVVSKKGAINRTFIEHIARIVDDVEAIAITGKWSFQSPGKERKKAAGITMGVSHDDAKYDYASVRKRNLLSMKNLLEDGDLVRFAGDIIEKEFDLFGSKANINYICQFIFHAHRSYTEKCLGSTNPTKDSEKLFNKLLNNIEAIIPISNPHGDKMINYTRGALIMGNNASKNNKWAFEKEDKSNLGVTM